MHLKKLNVPSESILIRGWLFHNHHIRKCQVKYFDRFPENKIVIKCLKAIGLIKNVKYKNRGHEVFLGDETDISYQLTNLGNKIMNDIDLPEGLVVKWFKKDTYITNKWLWKGYSLAIIGFICSICLGLWGNFLNRTIMDSFCGIIIIMLSIGAFIILRRDGMDNGLSKLGSISKESFLEFIHRQVSNQEFHRIKDIIFPQVEGSLFTKKGYRNQRPFIS